MLVVNPPQECFNKEDMFLSKWWALVQTRVMFRTKVYRSCHLTGHFLLAIFGAKTKAKKRLMQISSHLGTEQLSRGNPGASHPVPGAFSDLGTVTREVLCQL